MAVCECCAIGAQYGDFTMLDSYGFEHGEVEKILARIFFNMEKLGIFHIDSGSYCEQDSFTCELCETYIAGVSYEIAA